MTSTQTVSGRTARLPAFVHWLQPLTDRHALSDLLGMIDPLWSLEAIHARVERVIEETADTRTLILQANRLWPGFRAGQHTLVEVEIKGVRHQRSYSLSSAPGDGLPAITVKRQPGGLVSNFLHDHVGIGDVLTLSAPTGDFVLSTPAAERLLLIGAGSGITPLMSILRDLHGHKAERTPREIVLLQICRDEDDAIFGRTLDKLAAGWPTLRLVRHYSAEAGRLDAQGFETLMPDFAAFHTLLCGPDAFMRELQELWRSHGISDRLQIEHFNRVTTPFAEDDTQAREIRCVKSERSFDSHGQPLLIEAEQGGLTPKYGCRIGICRSCQCRKLSGTTQNLLTGEINDEPDQLIQLCISAARSDLQLDL